ncbi:MULTISPECIES: hypothetical protein [unclassified Acinetobacter]|uniref:hypothetical protein n=1 Tax=unclassified Acinetobacter TaxID=196816 RepID=UPI002934582C|nr:MULTISPECIES: hypothetical protein [unclassified Acinetobacter]WOE31574.1 hypothetical protein QSG84_14910 [Acinetobacter sp. SAAs470]WOE39771.1 hypothetical protein QSG86_08575 [Acinetobacter sp. SAAs474]
MKQDDFLKQVTKKLDGLAYHHQNKPQVMNHVLDHIENKKTSRFGLFKMSGFAIAATLAGLIILPNSIDVTSQPDNQVIVSPKLSPQMVEDLEMLMVLGEDTPAHGS